MHIYLMGYRGSGKSTVAKLLARVLDRPSIDTDQWIEEKAGRTIKEIFAAQGEDCFRDLEQQVLEQVGRQTEPAVVGLGGGAVLRPANQQLLLQTGRRVWLDAPADVLFQRISHDQSSTQRRPNLTDRGGYDEVAQMLAVRRPIYGRLAELVVNTQGKTPDQIVVEISDWQKHYEQPKLNS